MKHNRVLLKLSGEALMGDRSYGIDPKKLNIYAKEIKEIFDFGIEIAIVIGGGNIFRGVSGASQGIDRVIADVMGLLDTVIIALALQTATEKTKILTSASSVIPMPTICEPFINL